MQWLLKCDFATALRLVAEYLQLNGSADKSAHSAGKRKIVATYDYRNERGELLYQTLRYDPKDFRQRCPKPDGGWNWSTQRCRKVLYRLPELCEADPSHPAWIVEGEKDADRLASLECVATCNAGGAGKWRQECASYFKGRHVVVLVDNDEPGKRHGQQVAASLQGVADSVKVVELPGLPEKGDVADWLDQGGTPDELWAIVCGTPEWTATRVIERIQPDKTRLTLQWRPFPVSALPPPVARYVQAVADSIGCDPAFVALPLLSALAGAVGAHRNTVSAIAGTQLGCHNRLCDKGLRFATPDQQLGRRRARLRLPGQPNGFLGPRHIAARGLNGGDLA